MPLLPPRSALISGVIGVTSLTAIAAVPGPRSAPDVHPVASAAATVPFRTIEMHEPSTEDRYTLAGGCFTVSTTDGAALVRSRDGFTVTTDAGPGPVPFRLEPTDLGSYLLYGSDATFLAASEGRIAELLDLTTGNSAAAMADGASQGRLDDAITALERGELNETTGRGHDLVAATEASDLADWDVTGDADGFLLRLPVLDAALTVSDGGELALGAGPGTPFLLRSADGCAPWPEVEINVDGPIVTGASRSGETRGYLDSHVHPTGFERVGGRARCGRPWHRFGVTWALRGCPEHEDTGGRTHVLATVLSGRDPVAGHDTDGWPTFADWPAHDALLYEQAYHRWLERAWRGGLRLLGNLFAENEQLCTAYPFRDQGCDEMDSVRRQAQRTYELERYIDAQYGGPGKGWFRVVTDPFEARRVINEGRLAVVLGIEVSRLFDCRTLRGVATCDEQQIDTQLEEVHDLGIRYLLMTNWFDNALTGVKGHPGEQGLVLNHGNAAETGSFWQMQECDGHTHGHDTTQLNPADEGVPGGPLHTELFGRTGRTGVAPLYPPGPHCNARGLTDLGRHLLRRMVERGMIFDPDHMSARARHEALDILEAAGYSGVVSSHSWADDVVYRRVIALGGVVTPSADDAPAFVEQWRRQRTWADDRYLFGFGVGSDVHGFAAQGGPRGADAERAVTYPFEGFGGVTIDRQVSGERSFDVNVDGVAHYGLYPDWFHDLERLAGRDITADLERGPEAYLQMWERAVGVPPDGCRPDVSAPSRSDLLALPRGTSPQQVLATVGQPTARPGDRFVYCTADDRHATVHFDARGSTHVRFGTAATGDRAPRP